MVKITEVRSTSLGNSLGNSLSLLPRVRIDCHLVEQQQNVTTLYTDFTLNLKHQRTITLNTVINRQAKCARIRWKVSRELCQFARTKKGKKVFAMIVPLQLAAACYAFVKQASKLIILFPDKQTENRMETASSNNFNIRVPIWIISLKQGASLNALVFAEPNALVPWVSDWFVWVQLEWIDLFWCFPFSGLVKQAPWSTLEKS